MRLKLLSRFRPREIPVPESDLLLKYPQRSDFGKWLKLRSDSSAFLTKWEPRWPSDDLTLMGYQRRLRSYAQQRQTGTGYTFFLFNGSTDELLGGLSLTKVNPRCFAVRDTWLLDGCAFRR